MGIHLLPQRTGRPTQWKCVSPVACAERQGASGSDGQAFVGMHRLPPNMSLRSAEQRPLCWLPQCSGMCRMIAPIAWFGSRFERHRSTRSSLRHRPKLVVMSAPLLARMKKELQMLHSSPPPGASQLRSGCARASSRVRIRSVRVARGRQHHAAWSACVRVPACCHFMRDPQIAVPQRSRGQKGRPLRAACSSLTLLCRTGTRSSLPKCGFSRPCITPTLIPVGEFAWTR